MAMDRKPVDGRTYFGGQRTNPMGRYIRVDCREFFRPSHAAGYQPAAPKASCVSILCTFFERYLRRLS
jgi:hypothetical protein